MGGRGGMLVVSSLDGVIVEKVELCRKWLVGRFDLVIPPLSSLAQK
jgi:hypothetical protein